MKEVSYENERWNPLSGFGDKLLPTDRPHFSDITGTQEREKEEVAVPGLAWAWDDDWHIETLLDGRQLEMGGWTYAVDFPAEYQPKKSFTSCVRRRKWIRHRRYLATNSWSSVPGCLPGEGEEGEPFLDLSVGGQELVGGREGELQVWSVTSSGRVMVRQGVSSVCPQGVGWLNIPTGLGNSEVSQLSVATSGLVWAVTWQGSVLVRLGVSARDPTGTHWCGVAAPAPEQPLSQVSVGRAIVWAVSRSGGVWLRQGVRAGEGSEQLARGTRWVEMVGDLRMLCVGGGGDQVLGVGKGESAILARTGISSSDLTGKMWRAVTADTNTSLPVSRPAGTNRRKQEGSSHSDEAKSAGQPLPASEESQAEELLNSEESIYRSSMETLEPAGRLVLDYEVKISNRKYTILVITWISLQDQYDDIQWETGSMETVWIWVSLGSCQLDSVPGQWISEGNKSVSSLSSLPGLSLEEEPWRQNILQQLSSNNKLSGGENFKDFEAAIESRSWIKTSLVKVNTGGPRSRWEQCALELELSGAKEGQVEFGTLSLFSQKSTMKEHISLSEITCVSVCSEKSQPQLAVFTSVRSLKLQPLLVKFISEYEMEDWHGELVGSINSLHGTRARPSQNSIFSLTLRGEVLVWDSQAAAQAGEEENLVLGNQYRLGESLSFSHGEVLLSCLEIPVDNKAVPLTEKLCNGFGPGSALYTEIKIDKTCQNFSVNLQVGKSGDICLHFNPRLGKYFDFIIFLKIDKML